MRYFILLPGDTEQSVDFSTNILGEVSFKNFWADQGFQILTRLVDKYPDTLEEVVIKDEQSKSYSVEEFLETIKHLRVIQKWVSIELVMKTTSMMNTKLMKNLQNLIGSKVEMKMTLSNHKGSLLAGERVTLISLNEQKEEVVVSDPFGIEWSVPFEYLHTYN